MNARFWFAAAALSACMLAGTARAGNTFFFSTGDPDGLMATAARAPNSQIESADDFVTTGPTTLITSATFTGLITGGVPLTNITEVNVDLYHVFPVDSGPPSGNVPSRTNSPSDTEFTGKNSLAGELTVTPAVINPQFTANNSVLNGIFPKPGSTTGGDGAVTGQEVTLSVVFKTPFALPADHYFFVPTVAVTGGEFFWLSAPRPIVAPGTSFPAGFTDLQEWVRNTALDPDWLRVGQDIVGGSPFPTFNATFTLSGSVVPEPSSVIMLSLGSVCVVGALAARKRCAKQH